MSMQALVNPNVALYLRPARKSALAGLSFFLANVTTCRRFGGGRVEVGPLMVLVEIFVELVVGTRPES